MPKYLIDIEETIIKAKASLKNPLPFSYLSAIILTEENYLLFTRRIVHLAEESDNQIRANTEEYCYKNNYRLIGFLSSWYDEDFYKKLLTENGFDFKYWGEDDVIYNDFEYWKQKAIYKTTRFKICKAMEE